MLPLPPWSHQCRSGAPQRVAANPDTQQACLQTVRMGLAWRHGLWYTVSVA